MSTTELEKGCGKKTKHNCVSYYKHHVDDVEVFIEVCKKDELCEECQLRLDIINRFRNYCDATKEEFITYPELIKLVSHKN